MSDLGLAESLNEREYLESGEGIECQCCYGEFAFENMAQCATGEHLFCVSCLQNYAKESVYGQGRVCIISLLKYNNSFKIV